MKLQKLDSPGLLISRRKVKEQKGKVAREVVSVEYQICHYLKPEEVKKDELVVVVSSFQAALSYRLDLK